MSKTYYVFLGIIFLFGLLAGFLLKGFFFSSKESGNEFSLGDFKSQKTSNLEEKCELFVDVSGAVMNPGVVCLQEGAILNDAIVKADGLNPAAYAFKYVAQRVNLAKKLENEEKIYIPFRDDVVCKFLEDPQVKSIESVMKDIEGHSNISKEQVFQEDVETKVGDLEADCISINNSSKEEIMKLKGIGEAKATDIIEGRPYSKLEELKEVKGIGDKTFETLADLICL